jgi:hypothetical protein
VRSAVFATSLDIGVDVIAAVSFYGYLAFKHLLKTRGALRSHGVEVEYVV